MLSSTFVVLVALVCNDMLLGGVCLSRCAIFVLKEFRVAIALNV